MLIIEQTTEPAAYVLHNPMWPEMRYFLPDAEIVRAFCALYHENEFQAHNMYMDYMQGEHLQSNDNRKELMR